MFQQVRRQDRELDAAAAAEVLEKGMWGVLSMNGDYAYGLPLSYARQGDYIYFHCASEGKKLDLLRADPNVSFCVVDEAVPMADAFSMRYRSVIVFGRVTEVTEVPEKMDALIAIIDRYADGDDYRRRGRDHAASYIDKTVVFKLRIAHISGKTRK